MTIKVSDIRARLEGYPVLQQFTDFLVERMLSNPLDARYARLLQELNKISEKK